jgi:hypothetical protein
MFLDEPYPEVFSTREVQVASNICRPHILPMMGDDVSFDEQRETVEQTFDFLHELSTIKGFHRRTVACLRSRGLRRLRAEQRRYDGLICCQVESCRTSSAGGGARGLR